MADVDPEEAKRPITVAAKLKTMDAAQRFSLGNGMNVMMLEISAMPIISTSLTFNNTGEALTPDSPALSSLAAGFLELPTRTISQLIETHPDSRRLGEGPRSNAPFTRSTSAVALPARHSIAQPLGAGLPDAMLP